MALVVDPSSLGGQVFDDESADYSEFVLGEVVSEGAIVPTLFWYEIRNILVVNERRGRVTEGTTDQFLALLGKLGLEVDFDPPDAQVLALARAHGLSIYDAAYLELAKRRGFKLATLDRKLADAARKAGVSVFSRQ